MNLKEQALTILAHLQDHGYKAYFCGGCVRDLLLERKPKDYDIVTNATPAEIQKLFKRTVMVGVKFGVVRVVQDSNNFEVATFRKDGEYKDGRRPEMVSFCSENEDALRRDFTVNGLFWDPVHNIVIDYVGGQSDLERKVVRTIGDPEQRFSEDHLRLMRAIRFACQLNFAIESDTWKNLVRMSYMIGTVSGERVRDELISMLTGNNPARAIFLLWQSGILTLILPEIAESIGQGENIHALDTTLAMLEIGKPVVSSELAFGVLLHNLYNINKRLERVVENIGKRLHFSNKFMEQVATFIKHFNDIQNASSLTTAKLKKMLRIPYFKPLLNLYYLSCLAEHKNTDTYLFCQQKLESYKEQDLNPSPVITGNDLIQAGFVPGPLFQEILSIIEDHQLEGKISNRDQAIAFINVNYRCSRS